MPMRVIPTVLLRLMLWVVPIALVAPVAAAAMPVGIATADRDMIGGDGITAVRLICDSYGCRDVGPRRTPRHYRPPPALGSKDRPINPRPPGYYRPPPRPGYSQPRTPPQRYRPAPLPRYGIGKDRDKVR